MVHGQQKGNGKCIFCGTCMTDRATTIITVRIREKGIEQKIQKGDRSQVADHADAKRVEGEDGRLGKGVF